MSLVINKEGGVPVHLPKNRNMFKFDEEVAVIFEDMAQRSIPLYAEAHRLHFSMVKDKIMQCRGGEAGCTFFDIGGSTGRWLDTVREGFDVPTLKDIPNTHFHAYDNSEAMVSAMRIRFPEVAITFFDLTDPPGVIQKADIVSLFYVLQFIPNEEKLQALQWVYNHMNPGGILLLGQKERYVNHETESMYQEEYIRFRLRNGYTREEISAKTQALKNAMWCVSNSALTSMLKEVGFGVVRETSRWLSFSTMMVSR